MNEWAPVPPGRLWVRAGKEAKHNACTNFSQTPASALLRDVHRLDASRSAARAHHLYYFFLATDSGTRRAQFPPDLRAESQWGMWVRARVGI